MDWGMLCILLPIIAFCIFVKLFTHFEFIPKLKPRKKIGFLDMAGNVAKDYNEHIKN
jgi:hypothetical protein